MLAITFAIFLTSCSQDEELLTSNEETTLEVSADLVIEDAFAQEILVEVNKHRESIGLSQLAYNNDSKVKAIEHSKYMATKNQISHDNFFQRSDYLKAKGAARVSENVAYGYRSPEEVVSAWLKSESHKEAIEGDFTHSGLSVVKNEKGIAFFTQIFIKK